MSAVLMLFILSCNRKGCTNSNAVNFSESAKKDDGSCRYESTITFWFDEDKSDFYKSFDVTEFRFYLQDQLIGTADINDYLTAVPACGGEEGMTFTRSLGNSKNRFYEWEIRDQLDDPLQYGSWFAQANQCVIEKVF